MNGLNTEARDALMELAERGGGVLQPEAVVSAARAKSSPLHDYFTWDDGEAGRKYRLHQARQLISVVVYYEPRVERHVRAFVSLASERTEDGGYRRMESVISESHQRRELLDMALRELQRCEERYAAVRELAGVWEAAGVVRKKVKAKRRTKAKA